MSPLYRWDESATRYINLRTGELFPADEPDEIIVGADAPSSLNYAVPGSNVIYISPTGNNANPGTFASPKQTLIGAQTAASNGWTVIMRGGIYTGYQGSITKTLFIQPYPGETVIVDGQDITQAAMIVNSASKIRGLTFRDFNVTNDASYNRGIMVPSAGSGAEFEQCNFDDFGANVTVSTTPNGHGPLRITDNANVKVSRCSFRRSAVWHIYTNRAQNLIIDRCYFTGSNMLGHPPQPLAASVKHCRSLNAVLSYNLSVDNRGGQGFWLDVSCYNTKMIGNSVTGGYEAILIELSGTTLVLSNRITNGTTYGIRSLNSSQGLYGWNEIAGGNPHIELGILQDERRNINEPYFAEGVTWLSRNNQLIGNRLGGNFQYGQFGSYDYTKPDKGGPTQLGVDMIDLISGNEYLPKANGANETAQWSSAPVGSDFAGRSLTQLIAAHPAKVKRENTAMSSDIASLLGVAPGMYVGPVTPILVPAVA